MLINFVGVGMAFNKKTRETTWHQVILREEDYNKARAELSLFKGVLNIQALCKYD